MRKSFDNSKGCSSKWDKQLSDENNQEWRQFFKELLSIENTNFPRCLRPEDVISEPMLIVFSDGSKEAFGACVYIRWKVGTGPFWHGFQPGEFKSWEILYFLLTLKRLMTNTVPDEKKLSVL